MPFKKTCPTCKSEFITAYRTRTTYCSIKCSDKGHMNTPEKFWNKVNIRTETECWEWQGRRWKEYGQTSYNKQNFSAHRLAYLLTHGSIPDGMGILHSCNNPPCCNPKHLRPGTAQDNADDRVKAGHVPFGEATVQSKLTESQVLEIRTLYQTGNYLQKDLADLYNIDWRYIGKIVRRETWKHI